MNALEEAKHISVDYFDRLKKHMDEDTQKKVSAILDILEIGKPSIAHAKWVLHVCEETLDGCSGCFKTRTGDE